MSEKEALRIILTKICCEEGNKLCTEDTCPLKEKECVDISYETEGELIEAVKILKKLYDSISE